MNSINENQPEKNREDLRGRDAVEKIRELVGKAKTCFFCTSSHGRDGRGPADERPAGGRRGEPVVPERQRQPHQEHGRRPVGQLYFQGSPHSDFLHLNGRATISTDRAKIEELWEPVLKTWFTGGRGRPAHHGHPGHAGRRLLLGHQARERGGRHQDADRRGDREDARRLDRGQAEGVTRGHGTRRATPGGLRERRPSRSGRGHDNRCRAHQADDLGGSGRMGTDHSTINPHVQ